MFKRMLLIASAAAIISAGSTAVAHHPYRRVVRSYYAPAPVVRHYSYRPSVYSYYSPYRSYYYGYPGVRTYYAPPVSSYYAPAPAIVAPYGGVSVAAPGVSLRIGF